MNQLIVIIIILRNWLRPYSASLIKLFGCITALCISFAIYKQYNSIQSQEISIYCETSPNLEVFNKGGNLYVSLDYGQSENRILWDNVDLLGEEKRQIIGNYISYSGLRFPKDTITPTKYITSERLFALKQLPIITETLPDSIVGYTFFSFFFNYENNSWFMPRFEKTIRNTSLKPTILSIDTINGHITISTISELGKDYIDSHSDRQQSSFLGLTIGRKKRWFYLESLGLFNYPDSGGIDNSDCVFRQKIICPNRFYAPKFYSAYDVSKLNLKIFLEGDTVSSFKLGFRSPVDFCEIHPSPDCKDCLSIEFSDQNKLNYIRNNGLRLFVKFYEAESLQESRNYILSALITLFLTLTATIGWTLTKRLMKHKRRVKRLFNSLNQSHIKYTIFLSNIILFSNIIIGTILFIIIFICNPYDWIWVEALSIYIASIGFIMFIRGQSIPENEATPIIIKHYSWKVFFIGFFLILLGLILLSYFQFVYDIIISDTFYWILYFICSMLVGVIIGAIIRFRKRIWDIIRFRRR